MSDRELPEKSAANPNNNSDGASDPHPHHIADEPLEKTDAADDATVQNSLTDTGLPVEEQVRKEWEPNKDGGLPILLRRPRR